MQSARSLAVTWSFIIVLGLGGLLIASGRWTITLYKTMKAADVMRYGVSDIHRKGTRYRAVAVGSLLGRLKSGMTRSEVEALIGSPDIENNSIDVGNDPTQLATCRETYYAELKPRIGESFKSGIHLITIHYDIRDNGHFFLRYEGPHFPDD